MLLPKDHHVAYLILQDAHERLGHSRRDHVLSHVCHRCPLNNPENAVSLYYLSKTTWCIRHTNDGGLPEKQTYIRDEPPFTRSGVELFGPFNVKWGRSYVKRYRVIFTCLASRAVNIEMATSLETDSFIHALRRFTARRGQVKEMRSSCSNDRKLRKAIKEWHTSQIENILLQHHEVWDTSGVWERIIRSIRKIMVATLRNKPWMKKRFKRSSVNVRPFWTAGLLPCLTMTWTIWKPLPRSTCCCWRLNQTYHRDSSRQVTIMHAEDGSRSNTWVTYFGSVGPESTCLYFRKDRNGTTHHGTSSQEMSSWSSTSQRLGNPGWWEGSSKLQSMSMEWSVRFESRQSVMSSRGQ